MREREPVKKFAVRARRRAGERRDGDDVKQVVLVAVPPVRALDLFGPAEVFGDANNLFGKRRYEVELVSASDEIVVPSHLGISVPTDRLFRDYDGPIDTLLVAGGAGAHQLRYQPDVLEWLVARSNACRRFGSICTGAFVLAEAGLLAGRRATTHWNWAHELQRTYRDVIVDPDPIYVRDGNCYTSAGVTAGIDLCLALVEEDLGRTIALQVAQMMVVFLRRPAGQTQFSATLAAQNATGEPLRDLLAWLADNVDADLSVSELARRTAMSPRNFARRFRREVGKTPGRHIEDLRLESARRQLESSAASFAQIAATSGFASAEVLRRVFSRRLGVTPSQYRASFGRASSRWQ